MIDSRRPPGAPRPDGASSLAGGAVSVSGASEGELRTALALVAHLLAPLALAAGCALAMARAAGTHLHAAGLACFLAGVGLAYTVDRLREAPSSAPRSLLLARHSRLVTGLTLAFAAALLAGALALPRDRWPVLAALGCLVLAYPLAARLPGGKLASLAAAWTLAATALPLDGRASAGAAAALGLLVLAGGMLCDIKDARSDADAGRFNVAALAGAPAAMALALGTACLAGLAAAAAGARGIEGAAIALILPCAWPSLLRRELAGPLAVDVALAAGLLLSA